MTTDQKKAIASAARLGALRIDERLTNTTDFPDFEKFDTDQLALLEHLIIAAIKQVLKPVPIPR